MLNNRSEGLIYVLTTKFVFHQIIVTGSRKHWHGKCDHHFIPYYLDKKYRLEDTAELSS